MALQTATGTYTGNGGTSRSITGVGFSPKFLLIKGGSSVTHVTTTEMMTATIKSQPITGGTGDAGIVITSLDADGFSLGLTSADVNANGVVYYYLAIGGTADIKTGTYAGNATGPRAITGVGFQPTLVMFWDDLGDAGGWRSADMPSTDSWMDFGTTGLLTDRVFTLDSDGFTISFRNEINGTGRNYYYVAIKNAVGLFNTLTYTGNAVDDRNITGVGFQPIFALIKGTTNVAAARFNPEVGDNSFLVSATAEAPNIIQSFISDGVQVGTAANVNSNALAYYGFAMGSGAILATASYAPLRIANRNVGPMAMRRRFRQPYNPVYLDAPASAPIIITYITSRPPWMS